MTRCAQAASCRARELVKVRVSDVQPRQPSEPAALDGPGDAELISAVRGGDVDAYGLIFARHVEAARRLARQLVAAGDVDDLVSDAFAKVLAVLQKGGGPDLAFRAYLLTTLRRLHIDGIRAGSRLTTTDDMAPYDPGVPFEDTAVAGFDNAAATKAFASLPERWQQVLWHTEVEGQKPAEIAPLLGISANSVSALAYRAREGLRQAFISVHAQEAADDACTATRANLGAYLRGGLSRRESAKVDEHLAGCRECSAIYLELAEVNNDLGAVLAPLLLGSTGAGYLAASHAGAVAATKGGVVLFVDKARDWMLHSRGGRAAGAACGVVVAALVVAALALTHGSGSGPSASAPRPTPSDLSSPAATSAPPTVAVPPATSGGTADQPAQTAPSVVLPGVGSPGSSGVQGAAEGLAAPGGSRDGASFAEAAQVDPIIHRPLSPVVIPSAGRAVTIDLTRGTHDPNGDSIGVQSARVVAPAHGTVAIVDPPRISGRTLTDLVATLARRAAASTSVTYTPDRGWRGTDTIAYVLTDGHGGTVTGSVRVTTPNAVPLGRDDAVHVPASWTGGTSTRIAVLANDSDANHDRLRITALTRPAHGSVTVAGRAVRYAPAAGYTGPDAFGYTVGDGHGGTTTARVAVTVGALPNRSPSARSTTAEVGYGAQLVVDLSHLAADPDGDTVTFALASGPRHGTVTVARGGSATYRPDTGFAGKDSFRYTVTDGHGGAAMGTVTLTVDQPVGALHFAVDQQQRGVGADTYTHLQVTVTGIPQGRHATVGFTPSGQIGDWGSTGHRLFDRDLTEPPGSDVTGVATVGNGLVLHLDIRGDWSWSLQVIDTDFDNTGETSATG
jgi:RNA polymerase sigma factor (sigma-70 family)